jgi:predicted phage terminase large subunit-like protein
MGLMTKHVLQYEGQLIDIDRQLMEISRAECEESLATFVRQAWHVIEPGQPYVHGWHIDFVCEHLEAITAGVELDDGSLYNRLLINVPPGTMKSLLVGVFWPAWEWGPKNLPHHRFVCASHSLDLAIRDGLRMRRLITSEWYTERWGDRVELTGDQNQKTKFENTQTGFRQAAAAGSITGARGDRVVIDDPHSVDGANSDAMRESTVQWFREAVPTRLNNPDRSAIVVVMQRLHEADVSGELLDKQLGYDHIMLPMEYDPARATPTMLGYEDPREEDGELLFPERFPLEVVERDKKIMGPYATAGQFQQEPTPRGGGVIKPDWWETWPEGEYPMMDYIVASLDTAYTIKQENDYSALTIWGIFSSDWSAMRAENFVNQRGQRKNVAEEADRFNEGVKIRDMLDQNPESVPRVMLMYAFQERLELPELVQKVISVCKRMKVDTLLIESKAAGLSVAQEMRRLYNNEDFGVQLINPGAIDKLARLYSVQHLFSEGVIYAPDRHWADMVIRQCEVFPKGAHDDLVDTVSMALRYMRERNLLVRAPERMAEIDAGRMHKGAAPSPLYPI